MPSRSTPALWRLFTVAALATCPGSMADERYHGEGEEPDYDTRGWMGMRRYPYDALKCVSTLTRPLQLLICPIDRQKWCVKEVRMMFACERDGSDIASFKYYYVHPSSSIRLTPNCFQPRAAGVIPGGPGARRRRAFLRADEIDSLRPERPL